MRAVVLAAGEGLRMRPLTRTRPKHMIPLAGKPILEYLLEALRKNGIREVLLVVGYRGSLIQEYFGEGSEWGLDLIYLHQNRQMGTAKVTGLAEEYVEDEPFLMLYGDLLLEASVVQSVIRTYQKRQLMTLGIVPVANPERYGVIVLGEDTVIDIVEKPCTGNSPSNLANAGIYILSHDIFEEIRQTPKSPRGEYEITHTFQRLIRRGVKLAPSMISPADWMDIGRPWDLLEANKRVLEKGELELLGNVEDGTHLIGSVVLGKDARIRSGTYIEGPVYIGDGSDIGPNCYIRPFTNIGREVRVGNACEVKNSYILDRTHIAHLSYIGDSIIGEGCNLGAGTITANLRLDKQNIKVMVKGHLVDSGRRKLGVIMGDYVDSSVNVNFMPGVKIESYSWIGPGTTIYRDIASNAIVLKKQDLKYGRRPSREGS